MSSISTIILPIYQKYAPRFAKASGLIDLSIKDPIFSVKAPKTSTEVIEAFLGFILKNTRKPHLIISSTDKYLILKEENTLLDPELKSLFTGIESLKVSSRIGFGTKIQLPLK